MHGSVPLKHSVAGGAGILDREEGGGGVQGPRKGRSVAMVILTSKTTSEGG